MRETYEEKEKASLGNVDSLVSVTICKKCGNLAIEGVCDNTMQGNMIQKEYFASGTEPQNVCDCHVKISVCQSSNAEAGNYCPDDEVTTGVYLKSGTEGTEDANYVLPGNIGEGCEVHQHFWNQWFENEPSEDDDKPPVHEEKPPAPEKEENSWWDDIFHNWFW